MGAREGIEEAFRGLLRSRGGPVVTPTGLVRLMVPSKPRGAGLAILVALVFFVVETVLVILLKQVDPRDPVGVLYAALMAVALLANFVAGVVATRLAVLALNASRMRIVAAADAGRRQLERNLHDGVQQQLVALAVTLRMAEPSVPAELNDLKTKLAEVASGLTDVLRHSPTRDCAPRLLTD